MLYRLGQCGVIGTVHLSQGHGGGINCVFSEETIRERERI